MLAGVGRDHSNLGEKRQSGAEKDPKDQGKRPRCPRTSESAGENGESALLKNRGKFGNK